MVLFIAADPLGDVVNLLQIQMDLSLGRLHPEAAVSRHPVVSNLSFLHSFFQVFKGLGQPIKENIIRIMWPLCLIWILKVINIEAFQIKSLQRLIKLML